MITNQFSFNLIDLLKCIGKVCLKDLDDNILAIVEPSNHNDVNPSGIFLF